MLPVFLAFGGILYTPPGMLWLDDAGGNYSVVAHLEAVAAFAIPPANAPFGNVGRNAFRAPGLWQWDVGIDKSFRIPAREGMALQFRSEFFNILNHTNFGPPVADITSAAFGTIRSTFPPRQIQFALKLRF